MADVSTAATAAETAHEGGIHIALAAERLFSLWGIPITNTLLTGTLVALGLIVIAALIGPRLKLVPGTFQVLLETGYEFIYSFIRDTLESDRLAKLFFPFLTALFLFILVSNLVEFTPGIGSIGFHTDHGWVPLLRSVNTDLNVTLALTTISIIVIEVMGIIALGLFKYGSRFINFSSPIAFVVGLIELVSELARFVSFSFRLFGNIFAGEVMIAVVSFFVPYLLPVPLMGFEMFIGAIQAAIFAMLTLFFIKLAMTSHDSH